jgi:protein SCO1/2
VKRFETGPAGRFDLVDHFGRRVSEASYAGQFTLLFFGFTRCQVVCPRALTKTSEALDRLGPLAEGLHSLYVTVDPDRDDVAAMRSFLRRWPRFVGLTGTLTQVEAAKRAFVVFARRQGHGAEQRISHTAFTHLLDPAGRHVDHWGDHFTPGEIADRLKRHLRT